MSRLRFLLLALLVLTPPLYGQGASDLYVVDIKTGDSGPSFGEPTRLTDRDGYDNQPSFSASGDRIFYTSIRGEQSDIWQIELGAPSGPGEPKPLFETPESEYSPTPIPGDDAISVIRVEADGRQRLWRFPLDGSEPELILPDVMPVGYHAWSADGRELVLFVLDEPHRLVRVSLDRPDEPRTVSADIGRSLHRIPGRDAFSFIDKSVDGWRVASLTQKGDRVGTLAPALKTREDVAFLPDGSALGGDGSRLLISTGDADSPWREVADFGRHGLFGITRLAVNADGSRLALVAARAPEKARRLDIVDRAIAHHGGDAYLHSLTTLKQCSQSGCSDVEVHMDGEVFSYDVSGPSRDGTLRVLSGNIDLEAWRDGQAMDVPRDDRQSYRDWAMARVYFPFLPFRLNDPSVWKEDLGVEDWGGRSLHKVRVSFDEGSSTDADDVYLYWFDAETAELVQFAYSYSGNPGGLRFRTLENPRRLGGMLFKDQNNFGVEGPELTVDRLTPESTAALRLVSSVTFKDIAVEPLGR